MKYSNLDLEMFDYQKVGLSETFRIRVAESPVGEQKFSEAESVNLDEDVRPRARLLDSRKSDFNQIITLGEKLGRGLFPPRARSILDRSRERLDEDHGLRIRLKLDSYALTDLPWEYSYLGDVNTPADQRGADGFLVLDHRVSLVRYELMDQAPGTLGSLGPQEKLRLVAFLANPKGTPPLDLPREEDILKRALSQVNTVQSEFYSNTTIDILNDVLATAAHVFHFAGHGKFAGDLGSAMEGKGSISLVGKQGEEVSFSAGSLALLLRNKGVRLAVLGACEGGRRDGINAWSGIAPALTKVGVTAVVGMQFSIRDQNALIFNRLFYRSLATGQSIDEAVSTGRLAILTSATEDADERDWGVPVLYLRADTDDGVLFPRQTAAVDTKYKESEITNMLAKTREVLKGHRGALSQKFQKALEKIDVIDDYKILHDRLHKLQFSLIGSIEQEISRLADDSNARLNLLRHDQRFLRLVRDAQAAVLRKKIDPAQGQWVEVLDQARKDLKDGIDDSDQDRIGSSMQQIRNVVETQLDQINGALFSAVVGENEELPDLINIMNAVCALLQEAEPESVIQYQVGVKALQDLATKLSQLVREHNTWQQADLMLSGFVDLLDLGISAFEKPWDRVKTKASGLYHAKENEEALDLVNQEKRLDSLILKNKTVDLSESDREKLRSQAVEAFRIYCLQANEQFYFVDKSVLALCGRLKEIRNEVLPATD